MVSEIIAVCVTPPPVAVTVTLEVPVVAVLLAVNVKVELPLPGAAIEAALKLAVTPVGNPEADSATAELNPPLTFVVIVELPDVPCARDRLEGEATMVKSGDWAAFTVSDSVAVCVTPPPVPVMVTFAVPAAAVLLAVRVRLELPGVPTEAGLKLAVTPVGNPDAESEIDELKPPSAVVLIVVLAEPPCVTERLLGEALSVKSGVVLGLKMMSSTGCSSIWLGAAPVWPCGKSNIPTPVTCTGIFAVWKLVVAVSLASNFARALVIADRNGLVDPTQLGIGISVIIVLPAAS